MVAPDGDVPFTLRNGGFDSLDGDSISTTPVYDWVGV